MSNKPYLLTDVDGVLLNWGAGFKEYYKQRGVIFHTRHPNKFSLEGWASCGQFALSEHDMTAMILRFNATDQFGKLKAFKDAKSFLMRMSELYNIIAITSCSKSASSVRIQNLKNAFGKGIFHAIYCLDLGESKKKILSKFPSSIWIEDSLHGAQAGADCGHYTYLIDKPWNQGNLQGITRIKDLGTIV